MCILIGRDDIGLTSEEMGDCDAVVFIPADADYPVLNISHALAILLYEFRGRHNKPPELDMMYATDKEIENLDRMFYAKVSRNKKIRNRKAVAGALKRILRRARPTKMEINALHAAFSGN
jgi:tRNA C32,U32 (ribose-2'-O)-methylase TrmJ